MAVAPHHLAVAGALATMRRGGNAIDGAIAANAVQGVVAPETCGIGGDLFALVWPAGSTRPVAFNASGRAGSGVSAARMRDRGHRDIPRGAPESVTVPGCIDGWDALSDLGVLTLADCLAPAIDLARHGFPASPELAASLARAHGTLRDVPAATDLFPGGQPPGPGNALARPGLARTLQAVADGGRAAFYLGEFGAALSAATQDQIVPDDLARTSADRVEPLAADVWGRTGWTIPPNSQGWLTLAAAWLLEHLGPPPDPDDPAWWHAQIEAYRAVAWERDDVVADPDHLTVPPTGLVDPARLAARLATISPDRAAHWPAPGPAPGGTAYLCVVDGAGTGVSLIQSNFRGLGSLLGAGDTGVLLHDRGAGFCLAPGHPNELAPGKRPLHTLSPTVWSRDGELELLLGTRGGHQQPQYLLQAAAATFAAGLDPPAVQSLPRWSTQGFQAGAPSSLAVESRIPGGVIGGLRDRGHTVHVAGPWMDAWGPISTIRVSGDRARIGAADPRITTARAAALTP